VSTSRAGTQGVPRTGGRVGGGAQAASPARRTGCSSTESVWYCA